MKKLSYVVYVVNNLDVPPHSKGTIVSIKDLYVINVSYVRKHLLELIHLIFME